MNIYNIENNLLEQCLENLARYAGDGKIDCRRPGGPQHPDFVLTLPTRPRLTLAVECKANLLTRAAVHHAVFQARRKAKKGQIPMLVAQWIPEGVAEELRREGVYFMDMAGNAYLWHPPAIGIDIRGRKPEGPPPAKPGRIIEPAALKVCHLLLTRPRYLAKPLRKIAEDVGVAHTTVHAVLKELKAARYLVPGKPRQGRIADAGGFIETFVRGYALKLRPDFLIGRYRHLDKVPGRIIEKLAGKIGNARWALTGGLAAREITRHLEPDDVALFVDAEAEKRLKGAMLPDRNGNVTLFQHFGAVEVEANPRPYPLATPLLVYAELLDTGGAREVETARMILEEEILPRIE